MANTELTITLDVNAAPLRDYVVHLNRECDRVLRAAQILKWDLLHASEYNKATVRVITAR